ncbi:MAG: hypothetical protein NC299_04465 [Lachnospiraceae bacterium]|nr:hypothetical protein [Ruminococcus sp.]MCM1274602.1 hypothetical protein [Lachnospiraceae bacterium]
MSEFVEVLKQYYLAARQKTFTWYEVHPNNMPQNPVDGIYTYFWFKRKDGWEFLKYTIEYCHRVDEKGMTRVDEPVKYYVLHEFRDTYPERLKIPEPNCAHFGGSKDPPVGEFSPYIVNTYGRFRYVFDDEETAKKVVSSELLHIIYPLLHMITEEEGEEWNKFVGENPLKE